MSVPVVHPAQLRDQVLMPDKSLSFFFFFWLVSRGQIYIYHFSILFFFPIKHLRVLNLDFI